jgi:hypothetical protein
MRSKPLKLTARRILRTSTRGLAVLILFACLAAIISAGLPPKSQKGLLGQSEAHAGEAVQHSLDIGIAAQGQYPSSPLVVVRDLGVEDGIKRQIVSFDVKVDGISEFAMLEQPSSAPPAGGYPALI